MDSAPADATDDLEATREHLGRIVRRRAQHPELWYIRAHRASGLSFWAFGALVAMGFFAVDATLALGLQSTADLPEEYVRNVWASVVFFSLSLGFLAGSAPYIFPAARTDLDQLAGRLDLPEEQFEQMRASLTRNVEPTVWRPTLLALVCGTAHTLAVSGGEWPVTGLIGSWLGTVGIWFMMFQISWPLFGNAELFRDAGRLMRVDLYNPHHARPFGATALRPTLFIVGLQCAYPVLAIGQGDPLGPDNLIGVIASLILIVGVFFLPLRGIRARIRAERETAVQQLDARLTDLSAAHPPTDPRTNVSALAETAQVLELRERMARVSSWPLDLGGARRFLLYVILPPLTWLAAAGVEMLLESSW